MVIRHNPVRAARPQGPLYVIVPRVKRVRRKKLVRRGLNPNPAVVSPNRRNPMRKCRRRFKGIPKRFKVISKFLLQKLENVLARNRKRGWSIDLN